MTLTSEQVREPLDEESEGLIALGFLGSPFNSYAAGRLLSRNSCWSECRYWMLVSALNRHDRVTARIYLHDWPAQDRKPKAKVSKFVPGDHWHVLGTKFDTLQEAIGYLQSRGYVYAGFSETYLPKVEGD